MHTKNELKKNWDEERFEKIFHTYYEQVYGYMLYRCVVNKPALTLSYRVFERVLKNLDIYQSGQPVFETWLFTTTREVFANWQKAQKRNKRLFWKKWFFKENPKTAAAESTSQISDRDHQIIHGLESLTAREKEVLALKFGAQLSNRSISEQTGFNEQFISETIIHLLKKQNHLLTTKNVDNATDRDIKKFNDQLELLIYNPHSSKEFENDENRELLHTARTILQTMEPSSLELAQLDNHFFGKPETQQKKEKTPQKRTRLRPWVKFSLTGIGLVILIIILFSAFPNLLRHKESLAFIPGTAAEPTEKLGYNYSENLYLISLKDLGREVVSRDPAANGYVISQWNGGNTPITPLLAQRDQQNVLLDIADDGRTGIIESTKSDHFYGEKILEVYDFLDRNIFEEFSSYLREGQWLDEKRLIFIQKNNGTAQLMLYNLSNFSTTPLSPSSLNVLRYIGEDNGWFYWQAGDVVYDDDGNAEITPGEYWRSTTEGALEAVWDNLSGVWLTKNPRSAQLTGLPQECVLLQTNNFLQGCETLTFLDLEGNLLDHLTLNGGIKGVFFSPDGRQLLAAVRLENMESEADRVVWVDLFTREKLLLGSSIRLNVFPMENEFKREPSWSPDGKLVILGGDNSQLVIWSPEENFMRPIEADPYIKSILWRPEIGEISTETWATGEFDPEWIININEEPLILKHLNFTDQAIGVTLCTRTAVNLNFFAGSVYAHYQDNDLYLRKISDDYQPGSGQETICAEYLAVRPKDWSGGNYEIIVDHLVAQGATMFGDEAFEAKVEEKEQIKFTVENTDLGMYQVEILEKPQGMSNTYARQLIEYHQHLVKEGPWIFNFRMQQDGLLLTHPNMIDPAVCSAETHQMYFYGAGGGYPLSMSGVGNTEEAPSITLGDTLYGVILVCSHDFSTEEENPRYKSEIDNLGILIYIQTGSGADREQVTWVLPFTPIDRNNPNVAIESMVDSQVWNFGFPVQDNSDILSYNDPIQYVISLNQPNEEQAALLYSFSLTSSVDGFRPTDMKLEVITAEELETIKNKLDSQEETLLANTTTMDSLIESVREAMQQAIDPYEFANGWVHTSYQIYSPEGNAHYGGLTDYQYEVWEYLRAGEVVRSVTDYQSAQGEHLELTVFNNTEIHHLSTGQIHQPKTSYPFQHDPSLITKLMDYKRAGFEVQPELASWNGRWVWGFSFDQEPGKITKIYFDLQRGLVVGQENYTTTAEGEPQLIERRTLISLEDAEAPTWIFDALRVDVDDPQAIEALLHPTTGSSLPFTPDDITISLVSYPSSANREYWNGEIYAGEKQLGVVNFGDRPEDACTRSNSGSVVSFVYRKVIDNQFSVSELHWFSIQNPETVHQPPQDLLLLTPVFWSPVEEIGAFSACDDRNRCGIFLLDAQTNQIQFLSEKGKIYQNIIWNPDGSQLAFIDYSTVDKIYTLYIADIFSGELIWSGTIYAGSWTIPKDSPAAAWGVKFSDISYGDCFIN